MLLTLICKDVSSLVEFGCYIKLRVFVIVTRLLYLPFVKQLEVQARLWPKELCTVISMYFID